MKYYISLLVLIIVSPKLKAQEAKLLLKVEQVTDFSAYPIYPRLTEAGSGDEEWNENYAYLDSIKVFGITYLSDGLKVKGLLVKPKMSGKYPCIIYNRGGNREFSSLKLANGLIQLGQIAKRGYIVIASQYRGNGGSEGREEFGGSDVNDVLALIDVLEEVEGADTENIGMYGWSRGSMMTYIALTKTDKIKAAAVGGGVSDLYASIEDRPVMEARVLMEMIPGYEANRTEELDKRSAIKWADKFPKDVPILMLHGNADWRVKAEQSLNLALAFEKERVPYRLVVFEGGDHGITEHRKEVAEQLGNWFDKYLKRNEPLPDMEYHGR